MDVSYEVQMLLLQKIKNIIIKYISRSPKKNLKFDYDAAGNRVSKSAYTSAGVWIESTYYVRDAQGNVMSTYHENASDSSLSYKWIEQDLYGSSRIGMVNPDREMVAADTTNEFAYDTLNKRQYELSNHLGNILTVVYDHSIAVDSNGDNLVDYHLADIASVSDYSPFGAPLSGRGFTSAGYRYGFNGKESDFEIHNGQGTSYDYGFRIYDPRLGKFLSVDPLTTKYPWYTPYQFAGNKPIWATDLDGLEENGTNSGVKDPNTTTTPANVNANSYGAPEKSKDDFTGEFNIDYGRAGEDAVRTASQNNFKGSNISFVKDEGALNGKMGEYFWDKNVSATNVNPNAANPAAGNNPPNVANPVAGNNNPIPNIVVQNPQPILNNIPPLNFNIGQPFNPNQNIFANPNQANNNLANVANTFLNNPNATTITVQIFTNMNRNQLQGIVGMNGNPNANLNQLMWARGNVVRQNLINLGVPRNAFGNNWLQFGFGNMPRTNIQVR